MNQRQLIEVDPQRIKFNPLNPRKHRGTELIRLRESIKSIGIVQLPTVRILSGGFYEVIDGEGRVSIAQEEKFEKIWVVSVGIIDEQEALMMLQSANTTRSFNFLAECKGLANLHRQGRTNLELAKQFGASESKVASMVAIGYFPAQMLARIEEDIEHSEKRAEIWGYSILNNMLLIRELLPEKEYSMGSRQIPLDGIYDYREVGKAINKVISGEITNSVQMHTYIVNRQYEIYQARFDQDLQKRLQDELAKTREDLERVKEQQVNEAKEQTQLFYEGQVKILELQLKELEERHNKIINEVAKRPEIVAKREEELKEKIQGSEIERKKLQEARSQLEKEQEEARKERERQKQEWERQKQAILSEELQRAQKRQEAELDEYYRIRDEEREYNLRLKAENTVRGLLAKGIQDLAKAQQTIEHIISSSILPGVQQLGGTQQDNLLGQIRALQDTLDRAESKLTHGDNFVLAERSGSNGYKTQK